MPVDAKPRSVWIVTQESRLDNPILGVFGTSDEADAFMESLARVFPEDILSYGEYVIGWHQGINP